MSSLFAYLDLGAGSMFLQMILAGAMGAIFVLKTYWQRIMRFMGRKPADDESVPVKIFPPDKP